MGRFDDAVVLWREMTAEPRYHLAVVRTRRAQERAVRRHQQRVARLKAAVGTRAVVAGGSGATAVVLTASGEVGGLLAALVATSAGFGLGALDARRKLRTATPPPPLPHPVRPGSRAAALLRQLDVLAARRLRMTALLADPHAGEALVAAESAENLLRGAIHRMAAIEESAAGDTDPATASVLAGLDAEVCAGLQSYEGVMGHAVQLAGVVTAGGQAVAELDLAAQALEARTYGLRRLGEVGLA